MKISSREQIFFLNKNSDDNNSKIIKIKIKNSDNGYDKISW